MTVPDILSQIDAEIAELQQARDLLARLNATSTKTKAFAAKPRRRKRRMSAEGRARIAEAQRKRWAVQKKAAK